MVAQTLVASIALAAAVNAAQYPTWKPGATWQFAIQDPVSVPARGIPLKPDADVWDIDLWHLSKNKTIAEELHWRNKTIICYFNLGAVQPQDCDFSKTWYPRLWTGPFYGPANDAKPDGYYCERYVDLKNDEVMAGIKKRIELAAQIGCDGIDPDNIDVYGIESLNITEDEVVEKLTELVEHAHNQTTTRQNKLMFGQKNAQDIVGEMSKIMDFAVLERCLGTKKDKPFCNAFDMPYLNKTKPVVDIEYPNSLYDANGGTSRCAKTYNVAKEGNVCRTGKDFPNNMSRVLKLDHDDYGLNGCGQYCGDAASFVTDINRENKTNACSFTFDKCTKDLYCNKCCDTTTYECSKQGTTLAF